MAERRVVQLNCNIEPSIHDKLNKMLMPSGVPISAYLRRLVIDDLIAKGALAQEELLTIVA